MPRTRKTAPTRPARQTASNQPTSSLRANRIAEQLGVDAVTVRHIVETVGVLARLAADYGISPAAFTTIIGVSAREKLEQSHHSGFASAEEGLRALLDAQGGCVDPTQAGALLCPPEGIGAAAITARIRRGSILAYRKNSGRYLVPRWQFKSQGGQIDGLRETLRALRKSNPAIGPLTPFTFLLQPHPLTEWDTPLQALRAGRLDQALRAARSAILP